MSTTQSVANFYVDEKGIEQPIQYEAKDLVNKCAPEGYHWELDFRYYNYILDIRKTQAQKLSEKTNPTDFDYCLQPFPSYPTKYIAVKNKE